MRAVFITEYPSHATSGVTTFEWPAQVFADHSSMEVRTNFSLSVWLARSTVASLPASSVGIPDLLQELAKLTNQLLLANVRVAARTAVPGAGLSAA